VFEISQTPLLAGSRKQTKLMILAVGKKTFLLAAVYMRQNVTAEKSSRVSLRVT